MVVHYSRVELNKRRTYKKQAGFTSFMLKFLKQLFQKEEVEVIIPKEIIPFAEIDAWLEKNRNHSAKSIWETAQPLLEKIEDTIFAARANLARLEHAELRNKSIGARDLEIMKGNRFSYLKKTEQFLSTLASLYDKEEKEGMSYKELKRFAEKYKEELKTYHNVTLKPYAVLQHFFANESYAVAKNIKELDEEMKKIDALLKRQSTEALEEIQEHREELKRKMEEQLSIEQEKEEMKEEIQRFRELQQQAEEKKAKGEQSDGYQKYLKTKQQFEEQEKKSREHVAVLQHSFSVIEKAMRKYGKEVPEQEAFVQQYCENPVVALQSDAERKILLTLEAVKEKLEKNELDIKDEKKEKISQELAQLNKSFFETWLQEYKQVQEEKATKEVILHADVSLQHYKEAEYMVAAYKQKADAGEKQVAEKEENIKRLAIAETKEELEKEIGIALKREIEIQM